MKRVYLHFKEFELGFLTKQEDMFLWVPNSSEILKFFEKYDGAKDLLLLGASNTEVYAEIPYHFSDFVESSKRADLMKKAGINPNDSDFDKLCKMATLSYFNQDFFIEV